MASEPAFGSIGVAAFWVPPPLPTIIAVWVSLFPLILHLASSNDDASMIGELALSGRFQTGIFPRLGLYDGIARLLKEGADFLDQASSQGASSCTVWDVAFGSVFPCANSAAREMFTAFVKKAESEASTTNVETWLKTRKEAMVASEKTTSAPAPGSTATTSYRRYQTLHVITCRQRTSAPSLPDRFQTFLRSSTADALYMILCLALAALLCLSSAFGSAFITLLGGVSRLVCRLLPLGRPAGFPSSNEDHDASMLAAIHVNASTWYLYRGERGPIDWMLNKTMIALQPDSPSWLHYYFKLAHFAQLLAMTYVASQQGWDGVCLFGLMVVVWAWNWLFATDAAPTTEWIKQCGIDCRVASFQMTGRTPMLGAIQLLQDEWCAANQRTEPTPNWMDDILVKTPRRDAWTAALWARTSGERGIENETQADAASALTDFDRKWFENNTKWSEDAAACIKAHLGEQDEGSLPPRSPRP